MQSRKCDAKRWFFNKRNFIYNKTIQCQVPSPNPLQNANAQISETNMTNWCDISFVSRCKIRSLAMAVASRECCAHCWFHARVCTNLYNDFPLAFIAKLKKNYGKTALESTLCTWDTDSKSHSNRTVSNIFLLLSTSNWLVHYA